MSKHIVVVGSINLDLVASTQRIPIVGETVLGLSFHTYPGGKGANQAVAAARLGASVGMIGNIGDDPFGVQLKNSLEQSNAITEALEVVAGPSGVALINTDCTGQNAITVVPGANAQLSSRQLDTNIALIRSAGIVLTQLEIPLPTIEHLAAITTEEGVPLMLDPAPARPLPVSLLQRTDWLTPNETEACILTGLPPGELQEEQIKHTAMALLDFGCRNVILKLGARGCYLALSDGTRQLLPAYRVNAVDTTAAGDAFNGAFAAALASGRAIIDCASWASAVAAISVTRHGAQTSMPSAAEVDQFLEDIESVKAVL